jgi:predicted dehydrogenase
MLAKMPQQGSLEIAGGWDIDARVCAAAARDFPALRIAEDAASLISSPDIDIVYIGVPPAFHAEYANIAMAAGKTVFCEKPLGVDLATSSDLVDAIEASGMANAVNLSLAAAPGVDVMRKALSDGRLGSLEGADIRLHFSQWPRSWQANAGWLSGREQGGFVREVATHFIYLACTLLGSGKLVFADTRYPSGDDSAETHTLARMDFSGVPLTLAGSVGGVGPDLVEFTLWGHKKSFRLTDFYKLWHSDGDAWQALHHDKENPSEAAYMAQLDELVKMMDGKAHCLPDFRQAFVVQKLVEDILDGKEMNT